MEKKDTKLLSTGSMWLKKIGLQYFYCTIEVEDCYERKLESMVYFSDLSPVKTISSPNVLRDLLSLHSD